MPLAPAIAAALTDHAAHPWSLFVNGTDVIAGVPIYSVEIEMAAPGQVSAMSFDVNDIALALSIVPGQYVELHEWTTDRPRFTGWVSGPAVERLGMGKRWTVSCIGIERALDWAYLVDDVSVSLGISLGANVQKLCTAATWPGGFTPRFGMDSGTITGSQEFPVAPMTLGSATVIHTHTETAGTPLRQAITNMITEHYASTSVVSIYGPVRGTELAVHLTVDWYSGIRCWISARSAGPYISQLPTDYASITISDTYAGPFRASGLQHRTDGSIIVRNLVITTGAGNVAANDASGYAGPTVTIACSGVLTPTSPYDMAGDAVTYYFPALLDASTFGDFTLEDWTAPAGTYTHCALTITDTQAGLAAVPYVLTGATVTFEPGGENWKMTYGRTLSPSYVDAV